MARYYGILLSTMVIFVLVIQPFARGQEPGKVIDYNIACWIDLSGPYAAITKGMIDGTNIWLGYWNKTMGKKLGIKITSKVYDSQYNAAIVAARYPGVVASDRPIVMTFHGGPIAMSLLEKLPADKIPGIMITPMHGFMNKSHGWEFSALSTYAESHATCVSYWLSKWKEKRPMRVAGVSFESPAGEDDINGVKKYCETTQGIEWTVKEITPGQPVSLTTVIRRIIAAKTDYVALAHTSSGMATFYNGMKELGVLGKIPVANPGFFGLDAIKAKLGVEYLNGQFEAEPFDVADTRNEGAKIFFENRDEFAKGANWGSSETIWGYISTTLITQAAERAVKKVGAKNLTGSALFDELNAGKFHGYGVISDVQFNPENRLQGVTQMKVFEGKEGKIVDVSGFIPIPKISKWY